MKIVPRRNNVIGGIVQLSPCVAFDSSPTGVTKFVQVESVGPAVTECEPGDVVLPRHINVVTLGDGTHHVTFEDNDVIAVVEGVEPLYPRSPKVDQNRNDRRRAPVPRRTSQKAHPR
jgi:hypothetical protein